MIRIVLTLWFALIAMGGSRAAVIRVPGDSPTIQTALDLLLDGDTVLVALGTYREALVAPPLSFVLMGDVEADTGDYPRPTINPTDLPGSDSLACLILPTGSHPILENLRFRNGPEMYPRRSVLDYGGVRSWSANPVVRRCVFDSTFCGFVQNSGNPAVLLTFESCRFVHCSDFCIYALHSPMLLTDCHFSGSANWYLVRVSSHSRLQGCVFRDTFHGNFIHSSGSDIVIRDCVFGPYDFQWNAVELSHFTGIFEGNLFTEVNTYMIPLFLDLDSLNGVTLRANSFVNNHAHNLGEIGIGVSSQNPWLHGVAVDLLDNVFVDCESGPTVKAMSLSLGAAVKNNRFLRLEPSTAPAVIARDDSTMLRNNLFLDTDYALNCQTRSTIDARWNWWGHETGPYHATLNPNGQGDEVRGNVLFDPWHSDTSFLNIPDPRPPRPTQYGLSVYPNPFNSQARFRMELLEAGIYEIELFDILGRRVAQVFKGPAAYRYELQFDASQLSSGMYFARLRDVIMNRPLATAKLMVIR